MRGKNEDTNHPSSSPRNSMASTFSRTSIGVGHRIFSFSNRFKLRISFSAHTSKKKSTQRQHIAKPDRTPERTLTSNHLSRVSFPVSTSKTMFTRHVLVSILEHKNRGLVDLEGDVVWEGHRVGVLGCGNQRSGRRESMVDICL